ncbi:YjfB family protein [Paenibacillus athensensis]|nr:YjfB family protein [Paenibacillus athensensis]MCD1261649.1 YjfB family protein [Paenibacillus athensensis]
MSVNAALSAIGSGDALRQAIGIQMLSKVKDTQAGQAGTLLQDFAQAQQQVKAAASATPHLGQSIDVRV